MATMINGLGGPAGYGENVFSSSPKALGGNDDGAVEIDVTSVFGSGGVTFFGNSYTDIYVNSNGAITFGTADASYERNGADDFDVPALLPFYSDLNITAGGEIYWDVDPEGGTITITWDTVEPYSGSGPSSFQVVLSDQGGGEMDVQFVYEDIGWANGSGNPAFAGLTDGADMVYELDKSGNNGVMQNFEEHDFGTNEEPGVWGFSTTNMSDLFAVKGGSGSDNIGLGFIDDLGAVVTNAADNISGGAGDDIIDGAAGDDTIDGGSGNDVIQSGTNAGSMAISWRTVRHADNLQGTTGQDYYNFTPGYGDSATIRFNNSAGAGDGDEIGDYVQIGSTADNTWLTIGDFDMGTDKIVLQEMYTGISGTSGTGAYGNFYDIEITYANGNSQFFSIYSDDGYFDASQVFTTTAPTSAGGVSDNDRLLGGDDADRFVLQDSSGNDTIFGGEGGTDNDTLDATGLTSGVTVSFSGAEAGTLFSGSDTISFSEIDTLSLTAFDDSVTGGDGNEIVIAGAGNDTVSGGEGNDYIDGGDGDDLLRTGLGQDTLMGGTGNDTLMNSDGDDSLDGGAGDDSIVATGGEDTLRGGEGADTMRGGEDADTFIIEDNFGNDLIEGGEGTTDVTDSDFDTIDLSALSGPVTITYSSDEAGTITDGTHTITFSQIERIIGTDQADVLNASNDSAGLTADMGGGNDTITDSQGDDSIDAGDGDDYLAGNDGNDTFSGGAGSDSIEGGDGADSIDGGSGDDFLAGYDVSGLSSKGSATVSDDGASDTITGGTGNDTLLGGSGNDSLDGGADNDSIDGGADDDTITGGTGSDTLTGGDGDDVFVYSAGDGADTITDFNAGNSGALGDGDNTNNDFIDLSGYYDNLAELREDFADDGVLNQSNSTSNGGTVDYSDNDQFQSGDSLTFQGGRSVELYRRQHWGGVFCARDLHLDATGPKAD